MANSKKKLDRIDLDELFDSPVNRGMLSFLQRPPEEAGERLREKERINRLDSNRLTYPVGESPSDSIVDSAITANIVVSTISPVGESPTDVIHTLGNSANDRAEVVGSQ